MEARFDADNQRLASLELSPVFKNVMMTSTGGATRGAAPNFFGGICEGGPLMRDGDSLTIWSDEQWNEL